MEAITKNGLKIYQFEQLNKLGITHGFFTRLGGVSPKPFDSLNMATTVGDTRENVLENLTRMFGVFDLDLRTRYDGWQQHTTNILCVEKPRDMDHEAPIPLDGLLTDKPEVTLVMRFGDCVPVILFDPIKKVVGIYHAGWKGTVDRIGKKMIEKMIEQYGCRPETIFAGIGPSIGPDHFVVKEDVSSRFEIAFPDYQNDILTHENGDIHIDLWKTNELILREAGVKNIETGKICTVCNKTEWFSHRGDHGKSGRFGVLITLRGIHGSTNTCA